MKLKVDQKMFVTIIQLKNIKVRKVTEILKLICYKLGID